MSRRDSRGLAAFKRPAEFSHSGARRNRMNNQGAEACKRCSRFSATPNPSLTGFGLCGNPLIGRPTGFHLALHHLNIGACCRHAQYTLGDPDFVAAFKRDPRDVGTRTIFMRFHIPACDSASQNRFRNDRIFFEKPTQKKPPWTKSQTGGLRRVLCDAIVEDG